MGDYFAHWLDVGNSANPQKLPRIFHVNWFRKDTEGKFLWPGFGENIRVLKWIFERTEEGAEAEKTPIGYVPTVENFDASGLQVSLEELFRVDSEIWQEEVKEMQTYFSLFGTHLPRDIRKELEALKFRLGKDE